MCITNVNFTADCVQKRISSLAKALRVTAEEVKSFITASNSFIRDVKDFSPVLLIESSWREIESTPVDFQPNAAAPRSGEPAKNILEGKLNRFGQDPSKFELESIRLRYRMADTKTSVSTKFRLGFNFVVSLGIELNKVEEAGSDGIFDLHTVWFNAHLEDETTLVDDPAAVYERAVPPVALLHQ